MSYILDALRRADAERERGRVPGLHAQAMPLRTGDADGPTRPSHPPRMARTSVIAALLMLLALLAAFTWWGLKAPGTPGADPSPAVQAPALKPPPDVAPAAGTVASTAAGPLTPAAPAVTPAVAVAPAPSPILAPATAPATAPASVPAPVAATRPPAEARQPQPANEALPRVADLPSSARASLPPLQISGTTYAENPALRMLIVDGKVLQEGQDIAPGLTLEAIGPRSAVLNHQGRRLRLNY